MPEPPTGDDLNPRIHPRALPAKVARARVDRAADDAAMEPVVRPRIEANLTAVRLVLRRVEELHRHVADRTDLDLLSYSRASALWLMSGRCLGLLRAQLVQVEAGVCAASIPTYRALHEAGMLLLAFHDQAEDDVLRKWLDDPDAKHDYVKPWEAREAVQRSEERVAEKARELGLGELGPSPSGLAGQMYDLLSRGGHNRRKWCVDDVFNRGREMAYGVHPSPIRQAAYASVTVETAKEVTQFVGYALASLLGEHVWEREIRPLLASLNAVKDTASLDASDIRRAARGASTS